MKKYIKPEFSVCEFSVCDIITASNPANNVLTEATKNESGNASTFSMTKELNAADLLTD